MAFLSNLLAISRPSGVWESIIWAFEGFTNNYILAVVLITIILKIIWSPLETYNRHISVKNQKIQQKLAPELEKIQQKYGNDKQLVNQKTNELYKRNNVNMMGSCFFMLIYMALNLLVFFTLWSGLNNIASFKIYENYSFMKEQYANCLNVVNSSQQSYVDFFNKTVEENVDVEGFDRESVASLLTFRVWQEGETTKIGLFVKDEIVEDDFATGLIGQAQNYLTLDELEELDTLDTENEEDTVKNANDVILGYIDSLQGKSLFEETIESDTAAEEENVYKYTLLDATTSSSMSSIVQIYKDHQEKFLWIQNIWVADSPFKQSTLDYKSFYGLAANRVQAGEDKVYDAFMTSLNSQVSVVNGYLILPILCVVTAFLSSYLSQIRMKKEKKKQIIIGDKKQEEKPKTQGKAMMIIMPIIMGLFSLLYNCVFAIYMFVSQLISTMLIPLQNLIVEKIDSSKEKKKLQKDSDVDYRRKF